MSTVIPMQPAIDGSSIDADDEGYIVVELWSGYLFRVPDPPRPEASVEYLDEGGWQRCPVVWQTLRSQGARLIEPAGRTRAFADAAGGPSAP